MALNNLTPNTIDEADASVNLNEDSSILDIRRNASIIVPPLERDSISGGLRPEVSIEEVDPFDDHEEERRQQQVIDYDQIAIEEVQSIKRGIPDTTNIGTRNIYLNQRFNEALTRFQNIQSPQALVNKIINIRDAMLAEKPKTAKLQFNSIICSKRSKLYTTGVEYMSIFNTRKYLLPIQQDIEEIRNFFDVINTNDASVLLKEFRQNKEALINIIIGIIKITFRSKKVNITFRGVYDVVLKGQRMTNVVFDMDQYKYNNDIVILKKVNDEIISLKINKSELDKMDIICLHENGRQTENLTDSEVSPDFELTIRASDRYLETDNVFTKNLLEEFMGESELKEKIISFIEGSLLLYPEILEHLPSNITLSDEFAIFKYLELKEQLNDNSEIMQDLPESDSVIEESA